MGKSSTTHYCAIKAREIKFFELEFAADGIHLDPGKVKAIDEIEVPRNAKQLLEFLKMATYTGRFLPDLSQHTAPLRELLKIDSASRGPPPPTR